MASQQLGKPFIGGSINASSNSRHNSIPNKSQKIKKENVSIKDVFEIKKHITDIDQLKDDAGYGAYYTIFNKIRILIIILGLWAPQSNGCFNWFLRNIYPYLIYFLILYPWTTFITQEAYGSRPEFLFIMVHLSGFVTYYASRCYWNSKQNHLTHFITSTFVPFYDDIQSFDFNYHITNTFGTNYNDGGDDNDNDNDDNDTQTSLKSGFMERLKKDNKKRKKAAQRKSNLKTVELHSIDDAADDNDDDDDDFSSICSENKLSLRVFYEAIQKLWFRYWILSSVIWIPILVILFVETAVPSLDSSIDNTHKGIKNGAFGDIFIPINAVLVFVRIFYVISEFVFMSIYFKFICECHRGDLLIHLHYYDISSVIQKYNSNYESINYYNEIEIRLASIVFNWDRLTSTTKITSIAFRYWIFTTFIINFAGGMVAIINLFDHIENMPQHLEMYLPAICNILISFYIMYIGATVAHMNTNVAKRTSLLMTILHFGHVQISSSSSCALIDNNNDEKKDEPYVNQMMIKMSKQNLYNQVQAVVKASEITKFGITVYGMLLHRNLFLLFFAPSITFLGICLTNWLPKGL